MNRKRGGHERAPDQTAMTISCSKKLKDQIKSLAKLDKRNVSNWVVVELEKIVERKLGLALKHSQALHGPNEPEGRYGADAIKRP